MSRFKNEVAHLKAHMKTLRAGAAALFAVALVLGFGWWSAPRDLTIHVPPDLRSGSVRKRWEVPRESAYAFAFYVFQQLNRWPTNGENDYSRNIHALSAYLTPACPELSATSRRGASGSADSVCSVNTFWTSRGPVAIRYVIEAPSSA